MSFPYDHPWADIINPEFEKPYFCELKDFLLQEKKQWYTIYPSNSEIFKAFDLTPLEQVRVVILGQDPYHGPWQAMGLSFSVPDGIVLPPSLRNIYKELHQEGFHNYQEWSPLIHNRQISGNLTRWAQQGVLLLNSILTVRANQAASHRDKGREKFTDEVIRQIALQRKGVVYLLWWAYAQAKQTIIHQAWQERGIEGGLILKAAHPSPLSAHRGRFGCNHFLRANEYLQDHGYQAIEW